MKSFEPVYTNLEDMFINQLPSYIRKVNEEHNDGIILKDFSNKNLATKATQLPYFTFSTETAQYTEKDRIIENTVFEVSFNLVLETYIMNKEIVFWRYIEAIQNMLNDSETFQSIELHKVEKSKILIKITI